jgi:hypothetical protein
LQFPLDATAPRSITVIRGTFHQFCAPNRAPRRPKEPTHRHL